MAEPNYFSLENQTTTEQLLFSIYINASIGVLLFLIFIFTRPHRPDLYSPKKKNPLLPRTYVTWLYKLFKIKDDQVYESAGIDAIVAVKITRLGLRFCLFSLPVAFGVVLPLNYFGHAQQKGFDQFSMANIDSSDHGLLPVHCLALYYFTAVLFWLLHSQNMDFVKLRMKYLQKGSPQQYSILVKGDDVERFDDQGIYALFSDLYPSAVREAKIIQFPYELKKAVRKRDNVLNKLEGYMWRYATSSSAKRATLKKTVQGVRNYVDAIQFYTNKLERLNELVKREKEKPHEILGVAGFVTFRTLQAATHAVQCIHVEHLLSLVVKSAPEPRDVCWTNASVRPRVSLLRLLIMKFATAILVLLWIPPIMFVQSVVSVSKLSSYFPRLHNFLEAHPKILAFVSGALPPLILLAFMSLLPLLCWYLAKAEGYEAYSWIQLAQIEKLGWFYVIDVFMVKFYAGTFIATFQSILQDPQHVLRILGNGMPKIVTFFINYVSALGFITIPLTVSKIIPLVYQFFFLRCRNLTPRKKKLVKKLPPFDFAAFYPPCFLVLNVTISMAVINPFIYVAALFYFIMASFLVKYELLYVTEQKFESGGWLTLLGILILNKSYLAIVACLLLIPSVSFYIFENKFLQKPAHYLPTTVALAVDRRRGYRSPNLGTPSPDTGCIYMHRLFSTPNSVSPDEEILEKYKAKLEEVNCKL
ncbi:uncharacterized protein LOC135121604 isoform X3 [Zophobas morio]|uniref:uncharacterized protein LOC135121604 isoform X3 n=1 Tax=Zophobas morio TaxID=2755281 RepID=UPI003083266B